MAQVGSDYSSDYSYEYGPIAPKPPPPGVIPSGAIQGIRTYGRQFFADGSYRWIVVTTDSNGYNDAVYLTTLVQVFKLNLGESPFYGNFGLPAKQSIVTQVYPDFYVNFTQQQFAKYFTSLIVTRNVLKPPNPPTPVYVVNVVTQYGSKLSLNVPV